MHPLRRRLQNSKLLISSTWILGCLVSIPDVLLVKYEIPPGNEHPQCYKETKSMKGSLEVLYDLSVLTIQYIAPVLIMVYSYGMIALTIWRKTESGLVSKRCIWVTVNVVDNHPLCISSVPFIMFFFYNQK